MSKWCSRILQGIASCLLSTFCQYSAHATEFIGSTNSVWAHHVEWLLGEQMACRESVDDASPCNRFIGRALERIWGYQDFKTAAQSPRDYLLANEIVSALLTMKDRWVEIGLAKDQSSLAAAADWADKGYAVIAVRPDSPNGHVALVLPGP